MLRLFKKRKGKAARVNFFYKKMGELTERNQRKWADYMNAKVEKVSPFRIKLLLVLFTLFFSSVFVLLGVRSLSNTPGSTTVQKIRVPSNVLLQDQYASGSNKGSATLSVNEVNRIRQFRKYLDSLLITSNGKPVHDSLLLQRAGLLDSVRIIEKIFENQFKTK